jgi:glycosyltransferase involved in cell wall biosynthesis
MAIIFRQQERDRPRSSVDRERATAVSLAMVGTYPPRACGIATFTRDLRASLEPTLGGPIAVIALDRGSDTDPVQYPAEVRARLSTRSPATLRETLDRTSVGVVSLQHEFGLFDGPAGRSVLDLVRGLGQPLVTTLHTVPTEPDDDQAAVIAGLADESARIVVMSGRGRDLLLDRYAVDPSILRVIPHGVADVPFVSTAHAKRTMGFAEDTVILSYGLISPNKGLETAISALAATLPAAPSARLVIAGATHPEVLRHHGEEYRESLEHLAARLGVQDRVTFIDRYLSDDEVRTWLLAADVFVTPYGDSAQVTSGTLAYALASGRAIVSTPYEHARELLADDRGRLAPFGDAEAFACHLTDLICDPEARQRMRRRAWEYGRRMVWPAVAEAYADLFAEVSMERAGWGA